jgi:hypothetical protein
MSPILAAFDWQTAAVGALIGLSTIYLTRRYWKAWTSSGKKSCGGCGTCSAADSKPLVTLSYRPSPRENASTSKQVDRGEGATEAAER